METVLSGIQPSGGFHIGNYLGAVQNWVRLTETPGYRCFFCIVDLHAMTQDYAPRDMRPRVVEMCADLIACGLDPAKATLFVQSHVPEHAELMWALSVVTPHGELGRMTQFKDKADKQPDNINAGLFTYPILMAADIVLYKATRVPVGHDQLQHLELAREITRRWNARFGDTFPEPLPLHTQAPKILGLDGKQKMSKSFGNTVLVAEEPDAIRKKIANAYTDETRLRKSDPGHPDKCYVCGLHNYFSTEEVRDRHQQGCATATLGCVDSKRALAESLIRCLAPIRARSLELRAHPEAIHQILLDGAAAARKVAIETMREVRDRLGLYR
jgi:tryptophanyl-tRNA synthetase